jgi:hypothetical protein
MRSARTLLLQFKAEAYFTSLELLAPNLDRSAE